MEYFVTKNQKRLRCGITTGTCAAAAAKAAAALLLLGQEYQAVMVHTPKGIDVSVPVFLSLDTEEKAAFMVRKDSGDDPDVTNHAEIYVSVERPQRAGNAQRDRFLTKDSQILYWMAVSVWEGYRGMGWNRGWGRPRLMPFRGK